MILGGKNITDSTLWSGLRLKTETRLVQLMERVSVYFIKTVLKIQFGMWEKCF